MFINNIWITLALPPGRRPAGAGPTPGQAHLHCFELFTYLLERSQPWVDFEFFLNRSQVSSCATRDFPTDIIWYTLNFQASRD